MGTAGGRNLTHRARGLTQTLSCGSSRFSVFAFARSVLAAASSASSTRSCSITSPVKSKPTSPAVPHRTTRDAPDGDCCAGIEQRKEECRDARGVLVLDNFVQDLRYAGRQLLKSPGFTAIAVLMLGLGIGAALAIFGFVDAALIRPLPYRHAARLVTVTERTAQIPRANLSYLDYLDWKRQNTSLNSLDVHNGRGYMFRTATGTEMVPAVRVSDGFFRTLGVTPILGRDFYAGEDLPDAPLTVILSHATWLKRFGGRADVIGQPLSLNGQPYTVVGVLPQDFQFAPRGTPEMWTTLHPSAGCDLRRSCHNLIGVGRLKDAVTIETARAEMEAIAKQLEAQYPDSNRDQGASVTPLADAIVGDIRPVLFVLLGGAALLLVIACVNVSSLLLVRSESRRRELAVRSALGASRGRLNRQFVTEALLLVALGCALGLASAHWGMRLLTDLIPAEMKATMPFLNAVGLSGRVLACAGAIAAAITLLCSLAPMLRGPATEARSAMADGERGSSARSCCWASAGLPGRRAAPTSPRWRRDGADDDVARATQDVAGGDPGLVLTTSGHDGAPEGLRAHARRDRPRLAGGRGARARHRGRRVLGSTAALPHLRPASRCSTSSTAGDASSA